MTLGDLIKAYCDEHKMSLQTFADNAHASKGYISMLINGKNPSTGKPPIPTIKKLTGIAEAMGTTVHDLLSQTEDDTPTQYHIISPVEPKHESKTYESLAEAIVEKLRETKEVCIVSDDELRLIRAYRAAPQIIKNAALQVLESNQIKEKIDLA